MKWDKSKHYSESHEFFFDDEPLERILYDKSLEGPTVANLYLQVIEFVIQIENAYKNGHIQDVITKACELGRSFSPISLEICSRLVVIMKSIVPDYTNPIMIFDLLPLKILLEQIWMMALEKENKTLQLNVGPVLYRWHEHHGRYHEAREVLGRLMEINRELKSYFGEAIFLNNFAFEYMLEDRYSEAIPLFEEAARMFEQLNITFQYANSRANYWTCRVNLNDIGDTEGIEAELKTLLKILSQASRYYERKPLILLAQIEERRGNIKEAIDLVEQAIKSCSDSNTHYSEEDVIYLDRLQKKEAQLDASHK